MTFYLTLFSIHHKCASVPRVLEVTDQLQNHCNCSEMENGRNEISILSLSVKILLERVYLLMLIKTR